MRLGRILSKVFARRCKSRHVTDLSQQTRFAVHNDITQPNCIKRNNGLAACHRFEGCVAEPLVATQTDNNVCLLVLAHKFH